MLIPYPLKEVDDLFYRFTTDNGATYHIYFLDYSYMFTDYPEFSGSVFSFNIDIAESNNTVADERIGITVVEVFKIFFSLAENVAVYVCDNSDDRHLVRDRKFSAWFRKYNDGSIIKEDGVAVVGGMIIVNSLLIHRNNPHRDAVISAYKYLNESAGEK